MDVYKGIYLLSRQRDGQPNGWGANQNSQATDSWGVQWLDAKFWKHGIP
ncbi:MAG: hypothetical protein IGS03_16520 [Candidatus Sericytochromatia bacterium]|nr:hypothetical protein [Candidatus Sericytochromatia bacterium]